METAHSRISSAQQDSAISNYLDFKNQEAALNEIRKNGGEAFVKTLACIKSLAKDGKLGYSDGNNHQKATIEKVIIVQQFSDQGICIDNWLAPFIGIAPQCKNPLFFVEQDEGQYETYLSTADRGCMLYDADVAKLKKEGAVTQHKFRHEKNTLFTISNLIKLV